MTPIVAAKAATHAAAVWFGPPRGLHSPTRAALAALLVLACVGPGLSACGQKGPLKLPQQAAAASASAAEPAASDSNRR
jgi:predicted small lipoprotein YifL